MSRPSRHASALLLSLVLATTACGDDGPASSSAGSSSGTTQADGPSTTSDAPTTGVDASTGSSTTTSTSTGVPDTTAGSTGEESSTGEPVEPGWGAFVQGPVVSEDLDALHATHDALAMGYEAAAMGGGDHAHDVLLGTTILHGTTDAMIMIDQWDALAGAQLFYDDPAQQAALAMPFVRPPTIELLQHRPDWFSWGDLTSADGAPQHWLAVVRGRLLPDLDAVHANHDQVAEFGQEYFMDIGGVAHMVWVGTPDDPQQFLSIDVWNDDAQITATYEDAGFDAAFGSLFEAPPTVTVFAATDWYQW